MNGGIHELTPGQFEKISRTVVWLVQQLRLIRLSAEKNMPTEFSDYLLGFEVMLGELAPVPKERIERMLSELYYSEGLRYGVGHSLQQIFGDGFSAEVERLPIWADIMSLPEKALDSSPEKDELLKEFKEKYNFLNELRPKLDEHLDSYEENGFVEPLVICGQFPIIESPFLEGLDAYRDVIVSAMVKGQLSKPSVMWGIERDSVHRLLFDLQRELRDQVCNAVYGSRNEPLTLDPIGGRLDVVFHPSDSGYEFVYVDSNYDVIPSSLVKNNWEVVRETVMALPPLDYVALDGCVRWERSLTVQFLKVNTATSRDHTSDKPEDDGPQDAPTSPKIGKMEISWKDKIVEFRGRNQWEIAKVFAKKTGRPVTEDELKNVYLGENNPENLAAAVYQVKKKFERIDWTINNRTLVKKIPE